MGNIGQIIDRVSASLTWEVVHTQGHRNLRITSNPWTRTHTIAIPRTGADWREIEYLHELAHAVLAERHHLLATAWFANGTRQDDTAPLVNPVQVASDWYADHLLMQWCPGEEAAEIREHMQYVVNCEDQSIDIIYGGGLFIAQAVYYLSIKKHTVPRRYRPVVDVLLGVDPGKPSVQAKRDLVNALSGLTCKQRIVIAQDGEGMDVWKITK